MMSRNQKSDNDQIEMIIRKLESTIDFSFIYPLVESLYSTLGLPSIHPVVLIKMTFVQYVFEIRSIRQTIKEIETNMAYIVDSGNAYFCCNEFLKKLANWTLQAPEMV